MKHAYLIIAYDNEPILHELLSSIDDARNDIYVHIDKKSSIDKSLLHTAHAKLYLLPNSIDARWGDVSLVKVELMLISAALKHGKYSYLHLLSDSDYPMKSQDYIHRKCEELAGMEFISYADEDQRLIDRRLDYYHLFARHFRQANVLYRGLRFLFLRLQMAVGFCRKHPTVKKGDQWCSITYSFASYLSSKKEEICKMCRGSFCSDEVFMQTLCWASSFRGHLYKNNYGQTDCMRYIKWKDNIIHAITEADIHDMLSSEKWFARKFRPDQVSLVRRLSNHEIQ